MRLLLIGGLGFIGTYLARTFPESIIICRDTPDNRLKADSFANKVIFCNPLVDPEPLLAFLGSCDAAVNLIRTDDTVSQLRTTILDVTMMDHCVKQNLNPLFMHCGSRLQYAPQATALKETDPSAPSSSYAAAKQTAEEYHNYFHQHHKLRTIMLRIANVYGPKATLSHSAVDTMIKTVHTGITIDNPVERKKDFIFISDFILAFESIMSTSSCVGEVINVGSGIPITLKEAANTIAQIFKSTQQINKINTMNTNDCSFWLSIEKLESLTGFRPKVGFAEGIRLIKEHMGDDI